MNYTIGKMRESVEFKTNSPTAAGAGFADSYTTLLTTRGQLVRASENRSLSFGAIADNESYVLYVRFQSAIDAVLRSDVKIVISGVTYTMNGRPKLIEQRKHIYKFKLNAQLP